MSEPCKFCQEDYAKGRPDYFASDARCAFKDDTFSSGNWQCGTMNRLRDLVEDETVYSQDQHAALFAKVGAFLILGWYKSRGCTEHGSVLNGTKILPLTEKRAHFFLLSDEAAEAEEGLALLA